MDKDIETLTDQYCPQFSGRHGFVKAAAKHCMLLRLYGESVCQRLLQEQQQLKQ